MVKVYFETKNKGYSQLVAIFDEEETYDAGFSGLKRCAKKNGFKFVTESVVDEVDIADLSAPDKKGTCSVIEWDAAEMVSLFNNNTDSYELIDQKLLKNLEYEYACDDTLFFVKYNGVWYRAQNADFEFND